VEPGRPERPVRVVPGLGTLRFESIPRYGPLQERVGLDRAAVALGGKPAAHDVGDAPYASARGGDEAGDDPGEVYASLDMGAMDVLGNGSEIRKLGLEIHCKPPCGRSRVSLG
jgi:hypothetical protein